MTLTHTYLYFTVCLYQQSFETMSALSTRCLLRFKYKTDMLHYHIYHKRTNFHRVLIFMGKLPHENQTHKNLYTRRISNSNYGGLLLPTKINPLENITHEILWPRKFVRLRYLGNWKPSRDVSALLWTSATCFGPFCGTLNYPYMPQPSVQITTCGMNGRCVCTSWRCKI